MVKLGLLNLVRDIVVVLSQHDRSDVVSQVTPKLLRSAWPPCANHCNAVSAHLGHGVWCLCLTRYTHQTCNVLQITIGLLGEGEFNVVTQINNALITAGYTKEATAVGGLLIFRHRPPISCFHLQAACPASGILATLVW